MERVQKSELQFYFDPVKWDITGFQSGSWSFVYRFRLIWIFGSCMDAGQSVVYARSVGNGQ